MPRPGHLPANSQTLNYNIVDPKLKSPVIKENKNKKDERMAKIEKRPKEQAPGDTNDLEAWKKFYTKKTEYKVGIFKRENFTDTYKKGKDWVPGPGKHNITMDNYEKLSRSPPSIKIRRH